VFASPWRPAAGCAIDDPSEFTTTEQTAGVVDVKVTGSFDEAVATRFAGPVKSRFAGVPKAIV
jgi:hypothetical protein